MTLLLAACTWLLGSAHALGDLPGADPVIAFDVEVLDVTLVEDAVREGRPAELQLLGTTQRLLLDPSMIRSKRLVVGAGAVGAERRVYPLRARTFRGKVAGKRGSLVRIGITSDGILGYLFVDGGWTFIEPLPPSSPLYVPGAHRIYTDADLDPSFVLPCGHTAETLPPVAPALEASPPDSEPDAAPVPTAATSLLELELAVDTDFEYVAACDARGVDPTQEIEALVNMVDGIYQTELGLKLTLVYAHHWDSEPDPYTSTASNTLLLELREHWGESRSDVARDAVHLLTGKDLDGQTVGLAYSSAICRSYAYGLTQDLPHARALVYLVMAHEIGHNLGAGHDPDDSPVHYIMYPSVGGDTVRQFSDSSATEIDRYLAGTTCLSEILDGDGGSTEGQGGGGGGPVDPVLALLVGTAALTWRLSSRRKRG